MGLFSKSTPEEEKIKELTGKRLLSETFKQQLTENNLTTTDGSYIRTRLQQENKKENLTCDEIGKRFYYYLHNWKEINEKEKNQKLTDPQKDKIKEITGGFISSDDFLNLIDSYGLIPPLNFAYDLKEEIKNKVKEDNTPVDEIYPLILQLIINKKNNLNPKQQEKVNKEINKRNKKLQKEEMKTLEQEENERLKHEMIRSSAEATKQTIREGVKCKLIRKTEGQVKESPFWTAAVARNHGLAGYALMDRTKTEMVDMEIPATIKVVPKGVLISIHNDNPLKIPFEEIIQVIGDKEFSIELVDGSFVGIKDCNEYKEIKHLINENACGEIEEGWS